MKYIITISFVLISILSLGQNPVVGMKRQSIPEEVRSIDSVTFCSVKFKIPRECNDNEETGDELEPNCCSATTSLRSGSLSCYDGTTLSWSYAFTEERVKDIFESIPPQIKRQMKSFQSEPITCYLLGKQVNGVRATYAKSDGESTSSIFAYGIINSQPVYIQLASANEFKTNDDIPKGIRQIFGLKK